MENEALDRETAAAQLAALRADREALADRALPPWWYDALLGVVVHGLVVLPALVLELAVDQSWALVVAGAVAGVTAAVTSRWAGRLYVAELRGGS
jgi:hypothetical protein